MVCRVSEALSEDSNSQEHYYVLENTRLCGEGTQQEDTKNKKKRKVKKKENTMSK